MGLLLGDVRVEERRPRSWNEPREKRLSLVRDSRSRSRRRSPDDEWALVPHRPNPTSQQHQRQSSQELWDLRKFEAEQRFLQQEAQRLHQRGMRLHQESERLALAQGIHPSQQHGDPRMQRMHPIAPPHHREGGPDPRIQAIGPQRGGGSQRGGGYHHDDEGRHSDHDSIIEILSDESSDDGYDGNRSRHSPRRIDKVRDVPQVQFRRGRNRSRSRSHKEKKRSNSKTKSRSKSKSKKSKKSSLYSDSSDSDSSDFEAKYEKGFKAGIRAVSRQPVGREPLAGRGRSRGRLHDRQLSDDDDSFDDLYYERPRLRSKSRGYRRPVWGM